MWVPVMCMTTHWISTGGLEGCGGGQGGWPSHGGSQEIILNGSLVCPVDANTLATNLFPSHGLHCLLGLFLGAKRNESVATRATSRDITHDSSIGDGRKVAECLRQHGIIHLCCQIAYPEMGLVCTVRSSWTSSVHHLQQLIRVFWPSQVKCDTEKFEWLLFPAMCCDCQFSRGDIWVGDECVRSMELDVRRRDGCCTKGGGGGRVEGVVTGWV